MHAGNGLKTMTGATPRIAATLALTCAALLGSASAASAAQRYASSVSGDVVGSCTAFAPCRLDHAVNEAAAGDEVVVTPGGYDVNYKLSPSAPISIHGVDGQPRPQLIENPAHLGTVLSVTGGSVRHLILDGSSSLEPALALDGATGEDLFIRSSTGGGADVRGPAILRDSVVRVTGSSSALEAKDSSSRPGAAKILNVTAVTTGGDTAVKAKQKLFTTIVRNTIARGTGQDVVAFPNAHVAIDHSNVRPNSSLYTDAGGNQSGDPAFLDAAAGDLHEAATSSTVDAGTTDADLGAGDANAASRVLGAAPDMGGYEYGNQYTDDTAPIAPDPMAQANGDSGSGTDGSDSDGSGSAAGAPGLTAPKPPVLGSSVQVGVARGTVRVRTPGGNGFVPLADDASIPVNSAIDASHGVVELTSARDATGKQQTGRFWAGSFKISQHRTGDRRTVLTLIGGSFDDCAPAPGSAKAIHASGRRHRVRSLWGSDDHGRFRTRGRRGQATVRGTKWLTEDRCSGTLFKVSRGAIDVKAKGKRKHVVLHAGERYLAPAARSSRR